MKSIKSSSSSSSTAIKKSQSAPLIHLLSVGGSSTATGCHNNNNSLVNNNNTILTETMRRRAFAMLLFSISISAFLCVSFSLYSSRYSIYTTTQFLYYSSLPSTDHDFYQTLTLTPPNRTFQDSLFFPSVSVLLPDWEVLVIVSPEFDIDSDYHYYHNTNFTCFYPNNATSPARFSGILPSTNQFTFKCFLPKSARRTMPFLAPVLTSLSESELPVPWPLSESPLAEILRWNRIVYDSFSTQNDVVLFVKGLNNRQGINRSPHEFKCVFIDESNGKGDGNTNTVKTAVTSSIQEVFRCPHPGLTAVLSGAEQEQVLLKDPIKLRLSLEISEDKRVIPSVAYYTPPQRRKIEKEVEKSLVCATTMVYNVGKVLKEWVMYHSKIGVEKFILYDNESDDDLIRVVKELNEEGYNVETVFWIWPKTQEAGFSHAALRAQDSCKWMMYVDVDEFLFSPSWENSSQPSDQMLKSLLPSSSSQNNIGEVSIKCNEFGPSNQNKHPVEGVTQGYNCRRRVENRHKSIVLLEAIDDSLLNVIHHFIIKKEYRVKQLSLERAVVNHYKYQAWSEFKAKFRRRVSAYVVDWMQATNPTSQDRTPGLGTEAVEPPDWENKFCEVRDDRMKLLTQKWFGKLTENGYKLAWQS